jgi:hypothetical protein
MGEYHTPRMSPACVCITTPWIEMSVTRTNVADPSNFDNGVLVINDFVLYASAVVS